MIPQKRSAPRDHSAVPGILAGAAALLCVILLCLVRFYPGNDIYTYAPYAFADLAPESIETEQVPEYGGERYTYTFTVPGGAIVRHGARLSFYLSHTLAEVRLDDELTYSTLEREGFHIGKTPGQYWMALAMRSDYSGKTLKIRLMPVYKNMPFETPQFLLIEHGDLNNLIVMPADRFFLIFDTIFIISGAFLSLISLFIKISPRDKQRLFRLGAISFCTGLWKLTNLPVTALSLDYQGLQREIWYLGELALALLPLLITQFMNCELGSRSNTENFINAGLFTAVMLLQLFNILDLYETMPWYAAGCIVCQTVLLLTRRPERKKTFWLLPFPGAAAIDLAVILLTGSVRLAVCGPVWVACSLLIRGAGFINEALDREHQLAVKEGELQDARVRMMMQQIRPHFIYNTLTSVYVLCREDPKQAMDVIQNFTAYLQANFSAVTATKMISFSDELRHTQAYLAVESLRFGDKLSVEFDLQHTAFRLPPLTLQPLVENAVKYGVGQGHFPEHITVRTRSAAAGAVVTVEDNGPGFDPAAVTDEAHIGIRNIRDRLEMMCGGTLEIRSGEAGTAITVTIPDKDPRPAAGTTK